MWILSLYVLSVLVAYPLMKAGFTEDCRKHGNVYTWGCEAVMLIFAFVSPIGIIGGLMINQQQFGTPFRLRFKAPQEIKPPKKGESP